jgi:hypothetical protein
MLKPDFLQNIVALQNDCKEIKEDILYIFSRVLLIILNHPYLTQNEVCMQKREIMNYWTMIRYKIPGYVDKSGINLIEDFIVECTNLRGDTYVFPPSYLLLSRRGVLVTKE